MLIVIIDHGDGKHSYRGPFDSQVAAEQFAAWATSNIDPARTATLGDPLLDMLCAPVEEHTLFEQCPSWTSCDNDGDVRCQGTIGHTGNHEHRDPEGGVTLWQDTARPRCPISNICEDRTVHCDMVPGHKGEHRSFMYDRLWNDNSECTHSHPVIGGEQR